jgi:two-component system heavy metal sensor histidine kinase CusS
VKPRSIRWRLTFWYAGALAAALVLFGVLIQALLERRLISEIEEDLADRSARFESYFLHESAEKAPAQLKDELEEFCAALPPRSYVQLRAVAGIVVFRYGAPGAQPGSTRTLSRSFASPTGAQYEVTVGEPVRAVHHTIALLRLQLFAMTPLAIAIACIGGWLLSRRALKPLDDMARAAEAISIENLSTRLEVPDTGDELQRFGEVLNKMLARLEGAVETLSQFVADASHELRTPLALIRANAEIALRRTRSPEEYREVLTGIVADTERMTTLVEDLLFLARSDSAVAPPMQGAPIGIDVPLGEAIDAVKHLALKRSVRIVSSSNVDAYVAGNRAMLKRLFVALLDNAIKNSREAGEIRIGVERSADSITVSIRDFGDGIDAADLPHIFQRFYRADKSRTGEGYGLGLSIAGSIVRAHASEIAVSSAPGEGATFVVRIPVVATAPGVRDAAEISA